MKGIISLAAIFAMLFLGCGKEPIPEFRIVYYPNKKNMKEKWSIVRTPRGDTLEQGVHKMFYWDGAVAQSEVWIQGKREGSSQAWYESGDVKWQKSYVAGLRQGVWRLSYKGGHPWMVVTYDKDMLNGTVQTWDREDVTSPKEATFLKGKCTAGECALLEPVTTPADTTAASALELKRSQEIIQAFLN